jgi:hypothetical protein
MLAARPDGGTVDNARKASEFTAKTMVERAWMAGGQGVHKAGV